MELPVGDFNCDDAANGVIDPNQVNHLVFVVEIYFVFDALLIQRLQNHMAGAVGRVTRPHHRFAGVVVGVATKTALRNFAVWKTVKWQSHVL